MSSLCDEIKAVVERLDDRTHQEDRAVLRLIALRVGEIEEEIAALKQVPVWTCFVEDSIYFLALSILTCAWIVRTAVNPGTLLVKSLDYAIDSAERLAESMKRDRKPIRRSRYYPWETRSRDIDYH